MLNMNRAVITRPGLLIHIKTWFNFSFGYSSFRHQQSFRLLFDSPSYRQVISSISLEWFTGFVSLSLSPVMTRVW
jgi:hypothetical protein